MHPITAIPRAAARWSMEQLEARRLLSGGELDFGDAPDSYRTTLAVNGARHIATPNLLLGAFVDTEPDGQPDVNAQRDDLNGVPDDEDGIVFLDPIVLGSPVRVEVTNGAATGQLNAWLDFGIDGGFDAVDQIFTNVILAPASTTTLTFNVPAASLVGQTYARFRLSQVGVSVGPAGPGDFGEVEDYRVRIDPNSDLLDFGDAPDTYRTTFATNGARHTATPNLLLGAFVDTEPDGQPDVDAQKDDLNGVPDDEDGIVFLNPLVPGNVAQVQVTNGAGAGRLHAWLDFGIDGAFDPADQIFSNVPLAAASVTVLNFVVPAGSTIGQTYARFRLTQGASGVGPAGYGGFGEVEDYRVRIEPEGAPMDFGDAPDAVGTPFMYPTTFAGLSGDPARHVIVAAGPRLGATIDAEPDGQPTFLADGDDLNGIDDEDGVFLNGLPLETQPLVAGSVMQIRVDNGGADGLLNAWFDWNQNGNWEPATEQVAFDVPIPAGGSILLPVPVPGFLTANSNIYSRFRLSTAAGLTPRGPAPDGEVEDYRTRVLPDTIPPAVVGGALEFETRQAISLTFSEPLAPLSVSATDLNALNLDDGTTPVANSVILSSGNTVATWVFNVPGAFITDGDYSFTLPAGAVSDVAGNALAAAFNLSGPSIYFLGADANRDRAVTLIDFNILASNFGLAGQTFSQGNFDYDAAGLVSLLDFNILAARFGMMLAPAALTSGVSLFGEDPIDDRVAKSVVDEVRVV